MEKLQFKLEGFAGPLDLLLHLIKKNKVSIWDIPIAEITDQYLEAIDGIEESQLDSTSEFLVMATQLLYIKSKMLLPQKQEEEEEEDPREDLARRLFEYQIFKEGAASLRKNEFSDRGCFYKETEQIDFPIPPYSRSHAPAELLDAFAAILDRKKSRRAPERSAFSGIVGREKVSVEDMENKIRKRLTKKKRISFASLFRSEDSRPEMIATFLAVLELIKLEQIRADYDENAEDFIIKDMDKAAAEDDNGE